MCQPWLGDTVLQHCRLVLVMEAILFRELGGLPQSQGGEKSGNSLVMIKYLYQVPCISGSF